MRHPLQAALLALSLSGCASMVRYHTPSAAGEKAGRSFNVRSLGYFWGLIPPNRISLEQCGPPGIKKMKVRQGLIDGLITYCTLGIVISYKVKITCVKDASEPEPPAG